MEEVRPYKKEGVDDGLLPRERPILSSLPLSGTWDVAYGRSTG